MFDGKIGVVVTTYNSPAWLEKCFWGYEQQVDKNFQLIIADDGSTDETRELIRRYQERVDFEILHVWHEDLGFRKTEILNKAIMATDCQYLAFTDGDCIPRNDYIAQHRHHAKPGHFVSAGLFRLSMAVSEVINSDHVAAGQCFDYRWLLQHGQERTGKARKLKVSPLSARLMNWFTPTKATWNGGNSSGWRDDILAVNGFDERMQYGGLDRELGERMMNNGIRGIQARYNVIMVHLDHKRGYENKESWQKNRDIRAQVKRDNLVWTDHGIKNKLADN